MSGYDYFNFERNYDVLQSKSPCILLNENINFNKNETESEKENPSHSFRGMNLVFQLRQESQIKSKTVMSWSSRKKKEGIFYTVSFVRKNFFNICILFQCVVYRIHSQNIHTFYIIKNITSYAFLLVFKFVESLQCILNKLCFTLYDSITLVRFLNERNSVDKISTICPF